MASSSMSPASTSFGRLLKSSKVVSQFDASIPLVYTTHGGSKKRSDYGLKRALPKIKTAAIRVHSLDNSMTKLTDFSYAARERCFVEGFRESNVKVGGYAPGETIQEQRSRVRIAGEGAGACAWDKKGFQSIEDLKREARVGKQSQSVQEGTSSSSTRTDQVFRALIDSPKKGEAITSSSSFSPRPSSSRDAKPQPQSDLQFAPDYLQMSNSQFDRLLHDLEALRPKFLDYLRSNNIILPNPERQQLSDVLQKAKHVEQWGGIIDDFLAQELPARDKKTGSILRHDPKLNHIETSEHYAFGLTYATPNLYMSDQATRPLPVRWLDTANAKDSAGFRMTEVPGAPVSVLGTVSNVARAELPGTSTKWAADEQGNYIIDYGKGEARVEYAGIQHPSTKVGRASPDEQLYGVDVGLVDHPSKKPTIMDEDVVQLKLYKAGKAEGSLKPTRIGSPEWVRAGNTQTSMEDKVSRGDVTGVFGIQDSHSHRSIRPPGKNRYVGDPHIKGRKGQEQDAALKLLSECIDVACSHQNGMLTPAHTDSLTELNNKRR